MLFCILIFGTSVAFGAVGDVVEKVGPLNFSEEEYWYGFHVNEFDFYVTVYPDPNNRARQDRYYLQPRSTQFISNVAALYEGEIVRIKGRILSEEQKTYGGVLFRYITITNDELTKVTPQICSFNKRFCADPKKMTDQFYFKIRYYPEYTGTPLLQGTRISINLAQLPITSNKVRVLLNGNQIADRPIGQGQQVSQEITVTDGTQSLSFVPHLGAINGMPNTFSITGVRRVFRETPDLSAIRQIWERLQQRKSQRKQKSPKRR